MFSNMETSVKPRLPIFRAKLLSLMSVSFGIGVLLNSTYQHLAMKHGLIFGLAGHTRWLQSYDGLISQTEDMTSNQSDMVRSIESLTYRQAW